MSPPGFKPGGVFWIADGNAGGSDAKHFDPAMPKLSGGSNLSASIIAVIRE